MSFNSKDGFVNETLILNTLNMHYFKDLNDKWKRHMKKMFKNIKDDDYILVDYYEHKDAKPDLVITVNNKRRMLSIKSGHSPTMHHETVDTFYKFLKSNGVPDRIIRIMRFYNYGYSEKYGNKNNSLTREEILEKFSKEITEVNEYFLKHDEIVRELIYRTIIRGKYKYDLIDYMYYGNPAKGFLLSISDINNLIANNKTYLSKTISFIQLTYVSGARKQNPKTMHYLQIHWPILCKLFYDEQFMKRYG